MPFFYARKQAVGIGTARIVAQLRRAGSGRATEGSSCPRPKPYERCATMRIVNSPLDYPNN